MLVKTLKPIDSNLSRIKKAYGVHRRAHAKGLDLKVKQDFGTNPIVDRLQELHFTLLGTMVSIQSNPSGAETKEILDALREQILAFRKIKQILADDENQVDTGLTELAKVILIEFYDLEAMLRRLVGKKIKTNPKRSELIKAMAEKSKSATSISISHWK
ncbi:MAG: hypothetical protein IPN95_23705 [Bacteroidetes bacterium]|nr:hypothetical protein [Bacteroidota bacterium]